MEIIAFIVGFGIGVAVTMKHRDRVNGVWSLIKEKLKL